MISSHALSRTSEPRTSEYSLASRTLAGQDFTRDLFAGMCLADEAAAELQAETTLGTENAALSDSAMVWYRVARIIRQLKAA